jgi:hypothetical protein
MHNITLLSVLTRLTNRFHERMWLRLHFLPQTDLKVAGLALHQILLPETLLEKRQRQAQASRQR